MSKKLKILEGLRQLCAEARPGQTFTPEEIASRCACSTRNIQYVEKDALAKLRFRLWQEVGGPEGLLPGISAPPRPEGKFGKVSKYSPKVAKTKDQNAAQLRVSDSREGRQDRSGR